MAYNLLTNAQSVANTVSGTGNISLTIPQLVSLTKSTTASITVSGIGKVLCVDCDLGARVKVGEFRYYFTSSSASGTVAPTIEFYYRNDISDPSYTLLPTVVGTSYYYTTFSGLSAPRYVRLKHNVSDVIYGTANGLELTNNDTDVNFGADGLDASEYVALSLRTTPYEIRAVQVYNSSASQATGFVCLEPQGTIIDSVLSISTTASGPWYTIRDFETDIANYENTYGTDTWRYGKYVNTNIYWDAPTQSKHLRLISPNVSGTYTTRVFSTEDRSRLTFFGFTPVYPTSGTIVAVSPTDTYETVEIRSSKSSPIPVEFYRCLTASGGNIYYNDYWANNNTIKGQSGKYDVANVASTIVYQGSNMCIDKETGKTAACIMWNPANTVRYFDLVSYTVSGTVSASYRLATGSNTWGFSCSKIFLDKSSNIWVYFPSAIAGGWFAPNTNYIMGVFNPSLTSSYKLIMQSNDMDIVYDQNQLWYINNVSKFVSKMDINGLVSASYSTDTIATLVRSTADGGCWFSIGKILYQLDTDALLLNSFTAPTLALSISSMALDGDSAIWLADTLRVINISATTGELNFSVDFTSQPVTIRSTNTGAAVRCADNKWYFISKVGQNISKSVSPTFSTPVSGETPNRDGLPVISVPYNETIFQRDFPCPFDAAWYTLAWKTIPVSSWNMSSDIYQQVRLTLRTSDAAYTPSILNLFVQKTLELPELAPNAYKTLYLKSDINGIDIENGLHTSNLKAWWYNPL